MPAPAPRPITFQPDIYPKVFDLLPKEPGLRVLDAGAGEGYFSRMLVERGWTVEACGNRPEDFNIPGVPFHEADLADRIPCADGAFDCVVSIEVIEHVENHARFVREALRVTRPGGTVIVSTPNVLSASGRLHFLVYGLTDATKRPPDPAAPDPAALHTNPILLSELVYLAERAGGEVVAVRANRLRLGALVPGVLMYPFLAAALWIRLFSKGRLRAQFPYFRRQLRLMLSPAVLFGRILIAVIRKPLPA